MNEKTKQLHLWIGIISSVFILIESITGLLMTEPWLIGGADRENGMRGDMGRPAFTQQADAGGQGGGGQASTTDTSRSDANSADKRGFEGRMLPPGGGGNDLSGFIRNLHKGMINGTDVSWLIDLTAIAMIALTVTGIYLSIKTLRAQNRANVKKQINRRPFM